MSECAFLFPGQGAQYPGMGRDLAARFPECKDLLELAERQLGLPLKTIMFEGPQERLGEDLISQVAVYTISCMVADVLQSHGVKAGVMAPYSSGLYAAAYAAGIFGFETGLALIVAVDRCIRNQNTRGGMGVVLGLSASEVEKLCAESGGMVEVSIVNTRHQIIVSGENSALDRLLARAMAADALKADRLPADAPYHSTLLGDAGKDLAKIVAETPIDDPQTPIVSYIDGAALVNRSQIKMLLTRQLSNRVRWVDVVEGLVRCNHTPMVEVGPGQMLSRSVRWIHRRAHVLHTDTVNELEKVVEELGRLAPAGLFYS